MTVDLDEEAAAAVNEAITEIRMHRPGSTFEQELALAGAFVAHFGSLGGLFDEPQLSTTQFSMAGTAAWSFIGHWSVERGDPADEPKAGFEAHCTRGAGCGICQDLERFLQLHEAFEYENCEECGLGVTSHAIGKDQIGLPRAYCVSPWVRVDPLAHEAADAGGDYQISDAYDARWIAPLTDGNTAVITRYFYVLDIEGRVFLEEKTEYLVCTGVNEEGSVTGEEVGSEEVRQDVHVDDGAGSGTDTKWYAEQAEPPGLDEWDDNAPEFARGMLAEPE